MSAQAKPKKIILHSLTVQSADEVNIDLLSGLQSQAIYTNTTSITKKNTNNRMERHF
jgi:hypothetical protein